MHKYIIIFTQINTKEDFIRFVESLKGLNDSLKLFHGFGKCWVFLANFDELLA